MLRRKVKILGTLLLIAVVAIVVLAVSLFGNQPYSQIAKSSSAWEIATLDEVSGAKKYASDSLVTKNYLEVENLEFELGTDTSINYRVFYFDENKKFVGKTQLISDNETQRSITYIDGKTEEDVKTCKVVISPNEDYYGQSEVEITSKNAKSFINQLVLRYKKF